MINLLLSFTLITVFKAAFLRMFAAQRSPGSRHVAPKAAALLDRVRRLLNESQVNVRANGKP